MTTFSMAIYFTIVALVAYNLGHFVGFRDGLGEDSDDENY